MWTGFMSLRMSQVLWEWLHVPWTSWTQIWESRRKFSRFSSVPPIKCRGSSLNQAMTGNFTPRFQTIIQQIMLLFDAINLKPVLKTEINGSRDPLRWPRDTLYPQKLTLALLTSGGGSVGIVRLRTTSHGVFFYKSKTTESVLKRICLWPWSDNWHDFVYVPTSICGNYLL
jgi:hypothetical protein